MDKWVTDTHLAIAAGLPSSSIVGRQWRYCARGRLRPQRGLSLLGSIDVVAVGTAEGQVLKLVSESHAVVGVTLRTDECIAVVGAITHQVFHHLEMEEEQSKQNMTHFDRT